MISFADITGDSLILFQFDFLIFPQLLYSFFKCISMSVCLQIGYARSLCIVISYADLVSFMFAILYLVCKYLRGRGSHRRHFIKLYFRDFYLMLGSLPG